MLLLKPYQPTGGSLAPVACWLDERWRSGQQIDGFLPDECSPCYSVSNYRKRVEVCVPPWRISRNSRSFPHRSAISPSELHPNCGVFDFAREREHKKTKFASRNSIALTHFSSFNWLSPFQIAFLSCPNKSVAQARPAS